jgi:hypothetical protein
MKLERYELRDPGELVKGLADRVDLDEDSAWLIQVQDPSTSQVIVRVDRLDSPALIDHWQEARDEMRERIDSWCVPDTVPPQQAGVLVVVRPGLCVFGANESQWFLAWRYVNHFQRLFSGDLILVTEHGWTDFMTSLGGSEPSLQIACPT